MCKFTTVWRESDPQPRTSRVVLRSSGGACYAGLSSLKPNVSSFKAAGEGGQWRGRAEHSWRRQRSGRATKTLRARQLSSEVAWDLEGVERSVESRVEVGTSSLPAEVELS